MKGEYSHNIFHHSSLIFLAPHCVSLASLGTKNSVRQYASTEEAAKAKQEVARYFLCPPPAPPPQRHILFPSALEREVPLGLRRVWPRPSLEADLQLQADAGPRPSRISRLRWKSFKNVAFRFQDFNS